MNKKSTYSKILYYAKKLKAINHLGGKCKICGNDNFSHMEFHHIKDKKYIISRLLNGGFRWSTIKEELDKCELYCRNCHHEYHFNDRNSDDNRQITKQLFIEYKVNFCEECGYNKCQASLTFHHLDPNEKELQFSNISIRISSLENLKIDISRELDKCELLCHNCHKDKHFDVTFFEKNKKLIIEKSENLKEIQKKINRQDVVDMYNNGYKQIEIAKHFNASKGTISGIIKNLKIKVDIE